MSVFFFTINGFGVVVTRRVTRDLPTLSDGLPNLQIRFTKKQYIIFDIWFFLHQLPTTNILCYSILVKFSRCFVAFFQNKKTEPIEIWRFNRTHALRSGRLQQKDIRRKVLQAFGDANHIAHDHTFPGGHFPLISTVHFHRTVVHLFIHFMTLLHIYYEHINITCCYSKF